MSKKLILIGLLLTILIAIPLTMYLLTQTQVTTTKASPATHLIFTPQTKTMNVGETAKFDLDLDPGTDQNRNTITFINLQFSFNATTLEPAPGVGEGGTGLVINGYKGNDGSSQTFVILEPPSISCSNQCVIRVSLGVKPNYPINQVQHAFVSLNLHAKAVPDSGTAEISLSNSKVLSIGANDQASENVLSQADSAQITIAALSPSPTDATTPSPTDATTPTTSSGGGSTPLPTTAQQISCSSLTADQTSTTSAPLDTTFSVAGTASTGTISKVTFNFGDGSVQDVTSAGGIGTGSVNAQIAHTYSANGTFTATATLTGDSGAISNPSSCSQTITVGQSTSSDNNSGNNNSSGVTPTPTSVQLPNTGPGETVLLVGAIGAVIALGGVVLLMGL